MTKNERFEELLRRAARTPAISSMAPAVFAGVRLAGRFDVEAEIGRGALGRVYRALDGHTGRRVALKALETVRVEGIEWLRREFRSVADLVHPNLVRLYDLVSTGTGWFFTMELIEGSSLRGWVRPHHRLDVERAWLAARQIAQGVQAIHDANKLHRDLKPSNLLVESHAPSDKDRVVILDFGLATELTSTASPVPASLEGTPAYMAPELLQGGAPSPASDWYAVGLLLSAALSDAIDEPAVADFHPRLRRGELRPWSSCLADDTKGYARELLRLCQDLIRCEPAERPTGEEVLRRLGVPRARLISPPSARPEDVPFVGRSDELAHLAAAFERSRRTSTWISVDGSSGVGKTSLVEHFVSGLERAAAATVLRSRCYEREFTPYKALEGIIDAVCARAPALLDGRALPQHITDLGRLFPVLHRLPGMESLPSRRFETPDPLVVQRRSMTAMCGLFRLLHEAGPLVVWIDDLQWADIDSGPLLEALLADVSCPPLLIIGSARSEAIQAGQFVERLRESAKQGRFSMQSLQLAALAAPEAEQLARALLPGVAAAEARARSIARESAGNPFLITELARSTGPDEDGLPSLAALLRMRLIDLGDDARRLLELVSVAGGRLECDAALDAAALHGPNAERAVDILRVSRLIRVHGEPSAAWCEPYHDRIREALCEGLTPEQARSCHERLAGALEQRGHASADRLAAHWQLAARPSRALGYWLAAANRADAALAFDRAAELYQRALSVGELAATDQSDVRLKLAQALANAGRGAEAATQFLELAPRASPELARSLRHRAAEQLLLAGHLQRGLEVMDGILSELKLRRPTSRPGLVASVWLQRLALRARGLQVRIRTEAQVPAQQRSSIDVCWSAACGVGVIDFVRGAEFQARHLRLALDAGEPRRLARALAVEVAYAATPGAQGASRIESLLELFDSLMLEPDPAILGLSRLARGIASFSQGDYHAALRHCESAIEVLRNRCVGVVWETITAQRFIVASMFHDGQLAKLAACVPEWLATAVQQGNLYGMTYFRSSYSTTAWLVGDDVARARRELQLARRTWSCPGFQLPDCWLLMGEVHVDFYVGEPGRACKRIERAWQPLRRSRLLWIAIIRVQMWHLRAASALGSVHALPRGAPARQRLRALAQAELATRRFAREKLPIVRPLGSMLRASLWLARGNRQRAIDALRLAAEEFERQTLTLYAAAAQSRLGVLEGGERGERMRHEAFARLQAEGVVDPRRMVAIFAPGFPDEVEAPRS